MNINNIKNLINIVKDKLTEKKIDSLWYIAKSLSHKNSEKYETNCFVWKVNRKELLGTLYKLEKHYNNQDYNIKKSKYYNTCLLPYNKRSSDEERFACSDLVKEFEKLVNYSGDNLTN